MKWLSALSVIKLSPSYWFQMHFDSSDADTLLTSYKKTTKQQQEKESDIKPQGICCARCLTHITDANCSIEIQAAHQHTFENPAGMVFDIRLFSDAQCQAEGPFVSADSWFAGYNWRMVTCNGCRQHIGWSYQRLSSPDFYGLIVDRLVEFTE